MTDSLTALWQRLRDSQKQRIYILPSRAGFAYAGLLVLMLLGAINYSNSLGHLLSFLLAGLGHVTMHHSHRNLRQLGLSVIALDPVFCHQPARLKLTVSNQDDRDRFQLEVAAKETQQKRRWALLGSYNPLHTVAHIDADNTYSCTLNLPTQQRGWHPVSSLRIASKYPLGLFYSWTVYPQTAQVLVYPAPKGQRPLRVKTGSQTQSMHHEHQGEDDFAGLRTYRPGEALHRVAWKAMAKDDVMRSKQFSSPEGDELELDWHDLLDLPDDEARLSQLCRWLIQAEQGGHRYSLQLPGESIQADHGSSHQHRCLKALALYRG